MKLKIILIVIGILFYSQLNAFSWFEDNNDKSVKIVSFDLTNKEGIEAAKEYVIKSYPSYTSAATIGLARSDFDWLSNIIDKVFEFFRFSNEEQIEKQTQSIERIIEAGKRNSVKKMTVKVDDNTGIDVKLMEKRNGGKIKIGKNGSHEIEVEYFK